MPNSNNRDAGIKKYGYGYKNSNWIIILDLRDLGDDFSKDCFKKITKTQVLTKF